MTAVLEERTQFRQIGNSLGVIVSANIRKSGGFSSGDEVTLSCPRTGVITINSVVDTKKRQIGVLEQITRVHFCTQDK